MTLRDGERGRFGEPMVSWVSKDSDRRSVLVHIDGRVSLDELLEFLSGRASGVDIEDILINGSIRWERGATDEERAEREVWRAASVERHQAWERRYWAQMVEQYGPSGPPPPEDTGPPDMDFQVSPPETDGAGRPLPGAEWVVWAHHKPTGLRACARGQYKLPAVSEAITSPQELVAAENC